MNVLAVIEPKRRTRCPSSPLADTAFGCARDFLNHRYVYTVISPRARGLSVGVNLNPDKFCNFDCIYCEVNRSEPATEGVVDVDTMASELEETLDLVCSGRIRQFSNYGRLPEDLLKLRHVALSGDGEPTLCPQFAEVVHTLIHLRARHRFPFFKIVLISNASGLHLQPVVASLRLFAPQDEIWAKLDAGTPEYFERINKPTCSLEKIETNILTVARQRPVIIQSLFPRINGMEPQPAEIEAYAERLKQLKDAGARIPLVQVYSATRPTPHSECGHLELKTLAAIAQRVREVAGLRAEVF
jgi:wyosine [tRNA(Phe)-imidazoG37] synthetase (radical SAM superfamily)